MKKINTFIVPFLNNPNGLIKLVETLEKHTELNYNIIVINNGFSSGENCPKEIKEKITLWINPYRNLGFGAAMNLGIKLSTTKFCTIANDDVEIIYDGWWNEVMERFKEDATLGGFNPHSPCNKAADGNRYIQYEYKDDYTKEDIVKMKEIFHKEREYVGCCTYFTICKKEMFDKIGLFDERFFAGGEDYDLCIRSARGGYRIKGGSSVMVWHWWGCSSESLEFRNNPIKNA